MDGTLRVTPEQLESTASEFSNKGTTIANLTSNMTDLVVGLGNIWEGEAASAYVSKFRELDDDIQKINRMIQEHSKDLIDMATQYRNAEAANADDIQGLAGDVIV